MKKSMTLALAASIFVVTLAATPHRAMASVETYLTIDDGGGEPTPSPKPAPPGPSFWGFVCSLFGA